MKKIQLVVSDLDYTLLNSDRKLSPYTQQQLQKIVDAGVDVVPCSARPISQIPSWFTDNPAVRYLVCSNGAVIMDNRTKTPVKQFTLSNQTVLDVIHTAAITPYWTVAVDGQFHSHVDIIHDFEKIGRTEGFIENVLRTRIIEDNEEFILQCEEGSIEKVHMITAALSSRQRQQLICQLSEIEGIRISSSHPTNIEITHPDAGKGEAVRWLKQTLGLENSQVIACGDNENDLPMLKEAGIRIAVANATFEVLACADITALSCDEDGVVRSVCELLEIE